jgi:hypothetical protein
LPSLVAALAVAGAGSVATVTAVATAGPASASTSICGGYSTAPLSGGTMTLQTDEWNSSATDCLSTDGNPDFQVTSANFTNATNGPPGAYNSIYEGCHWGSCTSGDPFPIQVADVGNSVSTSVSTTQPGGSNAYDVAYDIWFNQTPTTSGQPNGEEMMIWLNHNGSVQPAGSQIASNVTIGGQSFNVWYNRSSGSGTSWNVVSYVLTSGSTSGTFNLGPLMSDSESRGYLSTAWYLIDIEMGFEIWQGGTGLAVNSFSVSTGGSGGTTTTSPTTSTTTATTTTTTGTGGSGACTATYSIASQWTGGFNWTVNVTADQALTSWVVKWTYANGQTVNNPYNANVSQSGANITATNMSYNGTLSSGQSTSFGGGGSWSGTNSVPALSCS